MAGREDDTVHTEENYEENQSRECVSKILIPEGFVVDDSQPSFSLEDIEEDNEVWLIDIPVNVDPNKLFGQQLDFRQDSFIIDEQLNERYISLPSSEPCSAICLLSSRHENSKKIVALNPAGKISINISYDVPEFGTMIPESKSVQLPKGLKVRHPFLGSRYKGIVKSMEGIEEVVTIEDDVLPFKHVTQRNKTKSVKETISTDLGPAEGVSEEILNITSIKNEVLSPKKSKKRKRESIYEDGNNEEVERLGIVPMHLSKKHKKEQNEGIIFQGWPKKERSSETVEVSAQENVPAAKSKKDKKRASEMAVGEEKVAALHEELNYAPNPALQTPKKKIKKEKKESQRSGEEGRVAIVSLVESPKKEKKKKDLECVSEAGKSDFMAKDVVMIGEVPGHKLERVKEGKNKLTEEYNERTLETSCKDCDRNEEVVYSESRVKKEKSKKRHTIENVCMDLVNENPNPVPFIAGRKTEAKTKNSSEEAQMEEIEVLHEEGDHVKKKRKKDKERASEIVNSEIDVNAMKEEVDVFPESSGQTPKRKKKKIKIESECGVKEEEVADISLVEASVPLERETPKKSKKKKKRDSEFGNLTERGDGVLPEDVTIVEEMPGQMSERVKKIKKEIKRESGDAILVESFEKEGNGRTKSSKRLTIYNVDMEDLNVDHQDSSLIAGRKGAEGMQQFNEEVSVISEEGDNIKKKRKKDKKRASEIVNSEMDVDVLREEVDVIQNTPGQTPKKKKKKIKVELECIAKEEVADISVVPFEVEVETPKKSKKKKKRDSEIGSGTGQGDVSSEDVVAIEMSEQTSELVGKSKKERWYIDCKPSAVETHDNVQSPHGSKKLKKACEVVMDVQHEKEDNEVSSVINRDSKKWKKRHTMDSAAIASVRAAAPDRVQMLTETKMEGKSQHKKRQSLQTQGYEAQLLSPKKEKKIKKELIV